MKVFAVLTSMLIFANSAFAQGGEDRLQSALERLHENVRVTRLPSLDKFDRFGMGLVAGGTLIGFSGGLAYELSTVLAPAVFREWKDPRATRLIRRFNAAKSNITTPVFTRLVGAGIAVYIGVGIARLFRIPFSGEKTPRSADYYKASAKHMNQFFALNLAQQHQVASGDQELTQFVLDLDEAYQIVDAGHPVR